MKTGRKLSYFEKLKLLYQDISEEYLLHYGSYIRKRTVESAAKAYFNSTMNLEPKERKRAEGLGLI